MTHTPYMRRKKIIEVLEQTECVDFSFFSDLFKVSEMTIRRDVEQLEKAGEVVRVYGGVKLRTNRAYEATIQERLNTNKKEKMAIAIKASELIMDGDVIALDASTTALEVSKLIKDRKNLTVVTNNISIAIELSSYKNIKTILLGGFLRGRSLSLIGASLKTFLESMFIDKVFLSSKALNFSEGLTDATVEEGEAKQAMIEKSNQIYVLVDHTKLGKLAFFQVIDKEHIDAIITDQCEPLTLDQEECLQLFRDYGVQVILADQNDKG